MLWIRDENLHTRIPVGKPTVSRSTLERGHWFCEKVVKAGRVWLTTESGLCFDRSTLRAKQSKRDIMGACVTAEDMEDDIFHRVHAWEISDAVRRCTPTQLRAIADILGYAPKD
jgi:hypothetical protein